MKAKTMVLMAVALGFGVLAAWFTYQLTGSRALQADAVDVLVARHDLHHGTRIDQWEKHFKMKRLPRELAPKHYLSDPGQLQGKSLKKSLSEDAHVTANDLYDDKGVHLPEGQVAFAIKVTQASGVGGWVHAGRVVNVIVVVRGRAGQSESKTLLERKLVLAAGDSNVPPDGPKGHSPPSTVVLAVTQQEAEELAKHADGATMWLSMLPAGTPEDKAPRGTQLVKVLVANHDFQQWEEIKDPDSQFRVEMHWKQKMPEGVISDPAELKGQRVNRRIPRNSIVTADDLRARPSVRPEVLVKRTWEMRVINGPKVETVVMHEEDPLGGKPRVGDKAPMPVYPVPAPDGK